MKSKYILTLAAMGFAAVGFAVEPQEGSGEINGYHLVWQDLFDSGELNPMRWDIEVNGAGGGNNELQYYTDNEANVHVGDDGEGNGCLILTAIRENYLGKNFTSGRVNSKGRIAFTHGKIEAAIKLPSTANGLWPAFWMMGNDFDDVGWPACGETDILEMGNSEGVRNGVQDRYFNGACHWGEKWPNQSYAKASTKNYSLQDGQFHLYTLIWDENTVKMYVDLDRIPKQNPYFSMNIPCDSPDNMSSPGNYFHKDNFILFNVAVGGNFPNIHNADGITALNDGNSHRASMYVNYVKIYQKGGAGEHTDFLDPGDPFVSNPENGVAEVEEDASLEYDGVALTSNGKTIDLFTLTGVKVASAKTGVLVTTGLTRGIYLASDGVHTLKIAVR